MRTVRLLLITALLATPACGDDTPDAADDGPATTSVAATDPYDSLTELLDSPAAAAGSVVLVSAVLFDDGSEIRMCEVFAESFPPQCMGRSLMLTNTDLLEIDWTEHESVRWTDRSVPILGWVDGDTFVVT